MIPYRLLLADDSLTIQKVVELVLADEHFEIKACNDGEQALAALESFAPDIVLADIEMPNLNGYQLCEKIKKNASTVHVPVILLAGAFEPFDENYAKSVGADDYIIKPFESQELISKVKSLLISPGTASQEEPAAIGVPDAAEISYAGESDWDEELQVEGEETREDKDIADEEYEAKAVFSSSGKAFEEEMAAALEMERPQTSGFNALIDTLALPSKEEILEIVSRAVETRVSDIICSDAAGELSAAIKEVVSTTLTQEAPKIIGDVTRELVMEMMNSLHGEIVAAIDRIVPEVAETVIKKEIEKITAET
ncbi:MAG TPA: response regulator [Dissulfurispiraceae bacterium]|nr:response regulator [Dissulfurispiraceae bacterium]